jgi:signal transduction histidine kinase
MGLGLTMCQSIIKAVGGILKAGNEPKGGAKFTIWLPYENI